MSAGWVAGSVRARALARRRLGPGRARMLAGCDSLTSALDMLAVSPYRRGVDKGQTVAEAQHGVAATLLWHLRVLAGWLPRDGVTLLRAAAGWYELANIDGLMQRFDGLDAEKPFTLGAVQTAWPRLADATGRTDLRARLAASPWGDPGTGDPYGVRLFLRLSWAHRTSGAAARVLPVAAGSAAALVAGERFTSGRDLPSSARERACLLLGERAVQAAGLAEMTDRLPAAARWALAGIDDPADLWRAQARCWTRLERDGEALLTSGGFGPEAVVGVVGVLAADAWRVRAALEIAAHGGGPLGVYDAVA
ncbi:hypothetical protein [Actinomadura miaoliensis]|uniref:V-type ATPase subunit n=1 Tax=Actinomadura miaoliensis TaxID=430685 RepID=A0ABP7VZA3_9ACTN